MAPDYSRGVREVHTEETDEYKASVHGTEVMVKHNLKAASARTAIRRMTSPKHHKIRSSWPLPNGAAPAMWRITVPTATPITARSLNWAMCIRPSATTATAATRSSRPIIPNLPSIQIIVWTPVSNVTTARKDRRRLRRSCRTVHMPVATISSVIHRCGLPRNSCIGYLYSCFLTSGHIRCCGGIVNTNIASSARARSTFEPTNY